MIHVAHLSDIHFGNNFNILTWEAVVQAVIDFDPDLIIVSGDLVDDPSPAHLLAAKCALADLLRRTHERANGSQRNAEIFVVPGNHDVFELGVAVGLPRLDWFERVFRVVDTSRAEKVLAAKLRVEELGFNATCVGIAPNTGAIGKWKARAKTLFSGRISLHENELDDFRVHLVEAKAHPRVVASENSPVLLALLDSNPTRPGPYAATGIVGNEQLIGLRAELSNAKGTYVARIAVVHHHVLPIAPASGVAKTTGEPMMVLRNAGAVLRTLADHKFDLILHGHWHKSQFTRIDFGSSEEDSYPMSVAAAGSAAMNSDETSGNCINLITLSKNGRISVKSVMYGAGQAPMPHGELGRHYRLFEEDMSAAKRRAYIRACERHPIECEFARAVL